MRTLRDMVFGLLITLLVGAADCREALLKFYAGEDHSRVLAAIEKFSDEEVERLSERLSKAEGDPKKQLLETSSAYLEHLIASLSAKDQAFIRPKLDEKQIEKIYSISAVNAEYLNRLITDPAGAIAEAFKERQKMEEGVTQLSLSRELYGHPVSFYLDILKDTTRLLYFENQPFYRKIAVIDASIPLPLDTLDWERQNQIVAGRQWDYLALIPKSRFSEIIDDIERQRERFLDLMPQADGKKEINQVFDEVLQAVNAAKDLSRSDYIANQKARFDKLDRRRLLKREIITKGIWYGIVGTIVFLSRH